ncbi:MAG: 23S rRNA (pseudouridine(1915)-N(3))-methyltransferase RlmH, partial [Deltaproteobacteria bacterium]|nr:23S rRNA (pseudouridine(1915)-N(3))-methyltransferase RlmH [Deltaproteobacteria bacterium]
FEAEKLSEKIPTGAYVIALDERGKQRTTEDWVSSFERWQQEGRKEIVFLMGGAYGFPDSILRNANEKWALSKLTFPHELARVIFLEQVYRVYTCMRKIPYHHGDPREP